MKAAERPLSSRRERRLSRGAASFTRSAVFQAPTGIGVRSGVVLGADWDRRPSGRRERRRGGDILVTGSAGIPAAGQGSFDGGRQSPPFTSSVSEVWAPVRRPSQGRQGYRPSSPWISSPRRYQEEMNQESLLWLALARVPGMPARVTRSLVKGERPLSSFFRLSRKSLQGLRLPEKSIAAIAGGSAIRTAEQELSELPKLGLSLVTLDSPRYPRLLRQIHDPPPALYCAGADRDPVRTLGGVGGLPASHRLREGGQPQTGPGTLGSGNLRCERTGPGRRFGGPLGSSPGGRCYGWRPGLRHRRGLPPGERGIVSPRAGRGLPGQRVSSRQPPRRATTFRPATGSSVGSLTAPSSHRRPRGPVRSSPRTWPWSRGGTSGRCPEPSPCR